MPLLKDKEWRLAFKFVAMFFLFLLATHLVVTLAPIISLFIIAVLFVYCISPFVNFLVEKKIPPFIAAGIVTLIMLFMIFAFFYMLIPTILKEFNQLTRYVATDFRQTLRIILQEIEELDSIFNFTFSDNLEQFILENLNRLPYYLQSLFVKLTSASVTVISHIWTVLGLLFLIFYLVQDLNRVKQNFTRLFPQIYHKDIGHVLNVIDGKVGAYIRGNILRCSMVGILTWIGLLLIGMPFSLILGFVAGVLNVILYIGPIIATIPAVLLSLTPTSPNPLLVLAIYIVVQTLDAFVLSPMLLGKAVNLRPLTIIIVLLIGGRLMGALGVIIAIPLTATLKVLLFHYYLKGRNLDLL
ncbi:MAG: AI-2E family transporter [Dethiobacteria bacterium]|jgi:predicted PurR-regulated permease PerM|nr:AI-2E family transporter [Bacillota bacterium]